MARRIASATPAPMAAAGGQQLADHAAFLQPGAQQQQRHRQRSRVEHEHPAAALARAGRPPAPAGGTPARRTRRPSPQPVPSAACRHPAPYPAAANSRRSRSSLVRANVLPLLPARRETDGANLIGWPGQRDVHQDRQDGASDTPGILRLLRGAPAHAGAERTGGAGRRSHPAVHQCRHESVQGRVSGHRHRAATGARWIPRSASA